MRKQAGSPTVALALAALLCLTVGPVHAGSRTYVTATETWVADFDPGEESFPDGRYHVRGGVSVYSWEASDPRLDGALDLVTISWNFRFEPEPVYFSGPMWGTFALSDDGGNWEGTWTGVREENGFSYFHFVGTGTGGYEGLKLRLWGERLDPDPYTVPESFTGYILESGG